MNACKIALKVTKSCQQELFKIFTLNYFRSKRTTASSHFVIFTSSAQKLLNIYMKRKKEAVIHQRQVTLFTVSFTVVPFNDQKLRTPLTLKIPHCAKFHQDAINGENSRDMTQLYLKIPFCW